MPRVTKGSRTRSHSHVAEASIIPFLGPAGVVAAALVHGGRRVDALGLVEVER